MVERKIYVYGNSDKSADGFPSESDIQRYIASDIFDVEDGRYRYTQSKPADVIVLSRNGLAYGHFDVIDRIAPSELDREKYPPVKKVYLIARSTSYEHPVPIADLEIGKIQFGKPITEQQLDAIVKLAGVVRVRDGFPAVDNRYCRICWNTNGWRKPSGSAKEAKGSYVSMHGFGHEEWLFNYEWCIDGYKYGFLQPVNRHRSSMEGTAFDVALYTKHRGTILLVGSIKRLEVPRLADLASAFDTMQSEGWFDQMRGEVRAVKGNLGELANPRPEHVINVRFRPENVALVEPMVTFPPGHVVLRTPRYQAVAWDAANIAPDTRLKEHILRSGATRDRAAVPKTTIDPRHERLQKSLRETLCEKYGDHNVWHEIANVDLRLIGPSGTTYFEIKMCTSAKRCIREAIGQLIEYAVYPIQDHAVRWVIVGDCPVTEDDRLYLAHLRSKYHLPVYYAHFDWTTGDIAEPI